MNFLQGLMGGVGGFIDAESRFSKEASDLANADILRRLHEQQIAQSMAQEQRIRDEEQRKQAEAERLNAFQNTVANAGVADQGLMPPQTMPSGAPNPIYEQARQELTPSADMVRQKQMEAYKLYDPVGYEQEVLKASLRDEKKQALINGVDAQGNVIRVPDVPGAVPYIKEAADTAAMDDKKYQDIRTRQTLKMPISAEESAWADAYKERKTLGATVVAGSRLSIFNDTPVSAYDTNTGTTQFVTKGDIAKDPGRYVGAEMAGKLKSKSAIFDEIDQSSKLLRSVIPKIKFNEAELGKFASVLKTDDNGSTIKNFLDSNIAKTLTKDQIDYVTAIKNMRESSYALRVAGGAGLQSSDMLRGAIDAMVPGPKTPNATMALRQMDLLDMQSKTLRNGIPGLGRKSASNTPSATTVQPDIAPAGIKARVNGKIVTSDGKGGWD